MSDEPFEGWCILELMGHRRLAGYVREQEIVGSAFLRIDVPSPCPSCQGAKWCPEHGDCLCQGDLFQNPPGCPLHDPDSTHGEKYVATQFYAPAAIYCVTPTTEEVARAVAKHSRPTPVSRFELSPGPSDEYGD